MSLAADLGLHVSGHSLHVPRGHFDRQRRAAGCARPAVRKFSVEHAVEHVVPRRQRLVHVVERRASIRALIRPHEDGRFVDRQVDDRLAEIAECSGIDSVESLAEINAVQIEFQDLLFVETFARSAGRERSPVSFRSSVRWLAMPNPWRASCWVIVLAPWWTRLSFSVAMAARTMPK